MARVKTFKAGYGSSAEIRGVWHKFSAELEVELDEGDDLKEVQRKTWNTVQIEVEKQIREVFEIE